MTTWVYRSRRGRTGDSVPYSTSSGGKTCYNGQSGEQEYYLSLQLCYLIDSPLPSLLCGNFLTQ